MDETIEKLQLLAVVSLLSAKAEGSQESHLGDEISRIIEEQRNLEARYEELIGQRNQLKGLSNKQRWKENQDEINSITQELRQSTKILCRNLKDNPNVGENLQKVQEERLKLQDIFSHCRAELRELTFSSLLLAVEEHKAKDDSLNELLQQERQAQRRVEQLKEDLENEKTKHAQDLEASAAHIAEMKEAIGAIKAQAAVEQKLMKKDTRSRADRNNRLFQQREHAYEEEIFRIRKELKIERRVHNETESYLRRAIDALDRDIEAWMQKSDLDNEEKETALFELRQKRNHDLDKLTKLDAKYTEEIRRRDARKAADDRLVEERKVQLDLLARVNNAALKIQALFRGARVRAELAKKKKKKKGKKGKGKK